MDGDGAVNVVPDGKLGGLLPHLARFALVHMRHTPHKGALQIAKGVRTHALDAGLFFDLVGQLLTQGAGARELHVAMRVTLGLLQGGQNGRSVLILNAL